MLFRSCLIGHTSVPLTESMMTKGEMVDDWWPLSGQEGEEREGMVHLILSVVDQDKPKIQIIKEKVVRKEAEKFNILCVKKRKASFKRKTKIKHHHKCGTRTS